MTSNRTINYDKGRGQRLKRFRTERLGIDQSDIGEVVNASNSKISMIEQGQMPPQEIIDFYVEAGINLHWAFTGDGPMEYKDLGLVQEDPVGYDSIRGSIATLTSDRPIDRFFNDMDMYRTKLLPKIYGTSALSEDETVALLAQLTDKIYISCQALKKIYPNP